MDEGKKLTPKLIQQLMMDGYERKARQAEKDKDYELARSYWQLSQTNAKSLARMSKPAKPKGFTKKTGLGLSIKSQLKMIKTHNRKKNSQHSFLKINSANHH